MQAFHIGQAGKYDHCKMKKFKYALNVSTWIPINATFANKWHIIL